MTTPTPPTNTALLRRFLGERLPLYWKRYLVAFLFMGLVAASTAASAWIMKDVVNEIFVNRSSQMLVVISIAVLVIFLVKGVASYFQAVIMGRIGNDIIGDTQKRMFAKLLGQDMAFVLERTSSEINTLLTQNANAARNVLDVIVNSIGRDVLALVGLVAVMVMQDPAMSLFMLVTMPVAVVLVGGLVRRMRRAVKNQISLATEIGDHVRQGVQGFRVIKAFGMEGVVGERTMETIDRLRRNALKIISLQARTQPIMETLGGVAIAGVIFYGGWRVIHYGQSPGEFFSFITALLLAYEPTKRLARARLQLEGGLVGIRMMYEFLDGAPKLADRPGATALGAVTGEIAFEDVAFAYRDGVPVLDGVGFVAKAGETTALVGPSGGGKSTVMSLILRFWDPDAGRVTIDGRDLRDVTTASLRAAIAYVGQDAYLFDGSVAENIRAARPQASAEEVEQAARAANAHAFITALPQGYDTRLGELAGSLSGGQRQRIAIARAFLRDAPIVLLDEPTSALDAESEASVQEALTGLRAGRTTIVIAHRLATVMNADRILVLEGGKIVENGTHADLVAEGGLYQRLHAIQFGQNGGGRG